ncbi:MAG: hypothetical protein NVS2B1_16160 [Bradyrhizobium sp.]
MGKWRGIDLAPPGVGGAGDRNAGDSNNEADNDAPEHEADPGQRSLMLQK